MTAGRTVGGYRLLRVIGEGGMGVVHLALDAEDREVAVKVVRPHVAADPETRARLAREVRSLLRVRHPRVAEVLDADFDAELPYVVMRYVAGEPLDALVRRDGPLTSDLLAELAVGLFEAVAAVHAVGVVHRDLKPGNVLMLDSSPVVIDFGIARALDDVALTSTGLMVGTPGYLSPEVLDGTDVGTAADWWGWGAVVSFATTGRAPFRSGPLEAVWDRVRRGAVDLDGVPEPWARLLAATLRPDPADRPSPEQLAAAVTRLTGRRPALPAAAGGGTARPPGRGTTAAAQAARAAATRSQPLPGRSAAAAGVAAAAAGVVPTPATPATRVQPRPDRAGQEGRDAGRPDDAWPDTGPARRPGARPAAAAETPTTRVVQRPAPPLPPADRPVQRPVAAPVTQPAPVAANAPTAPQPVLQRAGGATSAPVHGGTAPYAGPTTYSGPATYAAPARPAYTAPAGAPPRSGPPAATVPTASWPVAGASLAPVVSGPGPVDGRAAPLGQPRQPGAPVQAPPRRTGMALLGWLVLAAVGAVTPPGGAVLVLLWAGLARSAQWSRVAAAKSRARAGRLGAGARTGLALGYPFRLVGALLASAGYLLVGTLVVSPLLLVGAAVLLRDVPWDSWTTVQAVLLQDPVPSLLVVAAVPLAWFGPGGRAVRHGSRATAEPVARHRNGRLVLAGLAGLVVVAAVLVVGARV